MSTKRNHLLAIAIAIVMGLGGSSLAQANHPVLVEGNNCADAGPGVNTVAPGTCGDYDGDGRIGTAEDTDNATDRIFGTITAALAMENGGANQNGRITIVTSGRFAEVVNITAANGNVTLEAAPGVEANIDAVLAGDAGNGPRQAAPGIVVNAPKNRFVTLRNLVSRNWTDGIQINGNSRVLIDDCKVENNLNYGINVNNYSKVTITATQVSATGFRVGATGSAPSGVAPVQMPMPGIGISFNDKSSGAIADSTVVGSFKAGIADNSSNKVGLSDNTVFDNRPNYRGF